MAKTILAVLLVVLAGVLVSCHKVDSGASQLMGGRAPLEVGGNVAADADEVDIIEQMFSDRRAYRGDLESLIAYYQKLGDNMKLGWAKNELKKLDKVPQYNYIIEAGLASANLRARNSIVLADYMYDDALRHEKEARRLILINNESMLRGALEKYNNLIKKHPSSDKIDDAAFRAAGIFQTFNDYTIAVLYYQRTYQWDPATPYTARYKAAIILDKHLHRKAEALKHYQQAIEKEKLNENQEQWAKKRITILTKSKEKIKENK